MRSLILVAVAAVLAGCLLSTSDDPAEGTAKEEIVWRRALSPIHVIDTVRVEIDQVLVIERGVEVIFDADVPIHVDGAVEAHGTEAEPITFRVGNADEWSGIRITGGQASTLENVEFSGGNAHSGGWGCAGFCSPPGADQNRYSGGAIRVFGRNTRVTLRNGTFTGNRASTGGAVFVQGEGAILTLRECLFEGNGAYEGGALAVDSLGTVVASDCVFRDNTSGGVGGAISCRGLGIERSSLTLERCDLVGNVSESSGGAIMVPGRGDIRIAYCTIERNITNAVWGGTICTGPDVSLDMRKTRVRNNRGGITLSLSDASFEDCSIIGNTALGGIECGSSTLAMRDCTVSRNSASNRAGGYEYGGIYIDGSTRTSVADLTGCRVTDNVDGDILIVTRNAELDVHDSTVGSIRRK